VQCLISTVTYDDIDTVVEFSNYLIGRKMRRGMLELCLIIIVVIGIHAERLMHNGSIEGRISPAKASQSVIAVRGNDSVKVTSNDGHFGMELQPGEWNLIFAVNEYNGFHGTKTVQIREGKHVNLGEIKLSQ
jgi:hypothetical protein